MRSAALAGPLTHIPEYLCSRAEPHRRPRSPRRREPCSQSWHMTRSGLRFPSLHWLSASAGCRPRHGLGDPAVDCKALTNPPPADRVSAGRRAHHPRGRKSGSPGDEHLADRAVREVRGTGSPQCRAGDVVVSQRVREQVATLRKAPGNRTEAIFFFACHGSVGLVPRATAPPGTTTSTSMPAACATARCSRAAAWPAAWRSLVKWSASAGTDRFGRRRPDARGGRACRRHRQQR